MILLRTLLLALILNNSYATFKCPDALIKQIKTFSNTYLPKKITHINKHGRHSYYGKENNTFIGLTLLNENFAELNWMGVDPRYRGTNVLLPYFKAFIKDYPEVRKIKATYIESNLGVFLYQIAKHFNLDDKEVFLERNQSLAFIYFHENVRPKLLALNKKERNKVKRMALMKTPFAIYMKQIGFGKIAHFDFYFPHKYDVHLSYIESIGVNVSFSITPDS